MRSAFRRRWTATGSRLLAAMPAGSVVAAKVYRDAILTPAEPPGGLLDARWRETR